MKNTYYHPDCITKVNGTQLNSKIYKIGKTIKDKYYSYYELYGATGEISTFNDQVSLKIANDYDNFIALIKELFTASGVQDPIRSILGKYYVADFDENKNQIIYEYNSSNDITDKDKYPFPFKDVFTLDIVSSENVGDQNNLSNKETLNININLLNLGVFLYKYVVPEITGSLLLTTIQIFNFAFKDALNSLLQETSTFYYSKYQLQKHSEKNIASKNGNYLSYNLSSEYNQYIRQYENYFSSSLRRETSIPNYYITNLYLNDSSQQFVNNVVTLNNNLKVTKQTLLSNEYYVDLVKTLSNLTTEQKDSLPNIKNILLDDQFANIKNFDTSTENYPYNIDLSFNNFPVDGVITALENRKLNILATNNFYSLQQKTPTQFYIESENIIKTRTDDPDAYLDLDGERYNIDVVEEIKVGSVIGASYDSVLSFNTGFQYLSNQNLNSFFTEDTKKIYNSNNKPLSVFEYLKLRSTINELIEPKLTINTILGNSSMGCYPVTFDISKKYNNNVVQQTLIPRNSKINEITFVDTQVIYDKIYNYEVDVVSLVEQLSYQYQSEYSVATILTGNLFETEPEEIVKYFIVTDPSYSSLLAQPIVVNCTTNENTFFYKNNLFSDNAVIVDDPPTPIDVNIVPYLGSPNQLLFLFNTQDTTIKDVPVLITNSDRQYFIKVRHKQRPDKQEILFQSVSDLSSIQVYRTNTRPKSYRDFSNSFFGIIPLNGQTSTSIVQTLQQNTKYYYTFRSVDVHGNISNPSDIFEIKIINNDGAIYPIITPYYFEQNEKMNIEKSFKKYLSIDPAIVQQQLTINESGNAQLGIDNGFWNQTFKIRVTSKESGKAFDINLNFTKKIIETI